MTIIKEKKIDELLDVTFDRLRTVGALSGWQRQIYNLITQRLSARFLDKMMFAVNDAIERVVPETADREDVKTTIKKALLDYIDSTF